MREQPKKTAKYLPWQCMQKTITLKNCISIYKRAVIAPHDDGKVPGVNNHVSAQQSGKALIGAAGAKQTVIGTYRSKHCQREP